MLYLEVRLTPASFGLSHLKDISVKWVSLQYDSCTFKVRRQDLLTAPPSHSSHDCHSSFTQIDRQRTHCAALPSFLPLLHHRLMSLLLHRPPSHLCYRRVLDLILAPLDTFFAVDATVPLVYLIRFRLFGEWATWGAGGLGSHIFVGRNIPPTLIRWHNVTFHVCSTRGGPASGQASSWHVYAHEFVADFFFSQA